MAHDSDDNGETSGNGDVIDEAPEGASGAERLTEPEDGSRKPRLAFPVVGVGAGAGGLEAYIEFLKAVPDKPGMAFVLVQHLPPDRESLVAEILAKHTKMPVHQVDEGMAVQADHVYVIRPGHTLTIRNGHLHLGEPLAARGHSRPVDDFFRSLAEEQQQRAIAVVLSGMGSNGTVGAEAVEAVGGLVIAQDPETAKYPSMPRSLIDASLTDFVLRPSEIPALLIRYAAHPYVVATDPAELASQHEENAMREVLGVLRTRARRDFSGYRKPTLHRRILRRMGLGHVPTMSEYVKTLRQSTSEVAALADDMLIHVTGFFRDPEAWEVLREKVIEPLTEEREDGAPIRAWVTACATGEEAYTLAMLLVEVSQRKGKVFDIKVFATDMAERALGHARAGVFAGGIESELSPERIDRFFDRDDSMYRVKRELRDLVIFAPQNLLQDPPFSRLDIVSCRNLLIYIEPELQQRVIALLHFGLREGGALLLGTSESVGTGEDDFQVIDKKFRLFRRIGPTKHGSLDFPRPTLLRGDALASLTHRAGLRASVAQTANRMLLEAFTPAAVVVDSMGQIVYFHGNTGRYLDQPRGEPSSELLALANEQVRGTVRLALQQAIDQNQPVSLRDGLIDTPEGRRRVEIGITPLERRPNGANYLVVFRDHPETFPPPLPEEGETSDQQMVEELQRVRDVLQTTLEEMQTSNEELKASHEEATSINEELQSTNEELETSKEELQSLNEELTTVNAQYHAKMLELEATSNDLASLLASTSIAVLFLDRRFRIRRFTPAVADLVDLIPTDVGRPLADMRRKFTDPDLLRDAQTVLDRLVPMEREIRSDAGRDYIRRVLPYRTGDNRIDGVVVTFVDFTELSRAGIAFKSLKEESAITEERLRIALAAARMGIWTLDTATGTQMRDANLNRLLGLPAVETVQPFEEFLSHIHADDHLLVETAFEVSIREGRNLNTEFRIVRPDGTVRWLRDQGDVFGQNPVAYLAGACVDVTERREAEEALRASEERLRQIVEGAVDYAIMTLAPDRSITSWSPGAAATFGYSTEEILGRSADVLFTPEDRDAGEQIKETEVARRRGRAADERWHLRKDGTRFYASGVLTSLGDDRGFVKVARDLTDRKRMEDELRDAHDKLEERVEERTAELAAATASLEAEVSRRIELARRLATAQEDERRRIARDLHDQTGQLLAGLSLAVKLVSSRGPMPKTMIEDLKSVQQVADELGKQVHSLAIRLRPTALDDLGLVAAIRQLVIEWSQRIAVPIDFHASDMTETRLPAQIETTLYRVVQEALTNVAKHANATIVSVVLTCTDGMATAVVEDNGVGFDPTTAGQSRIGLLGMNERIDAAGGNFAIESEPGRGTTILARVPVYSQEG